MKFIITHKGNKMLVAKKDDSKNVIYTIAKKGILSNTRMELYNKMGYNLYSLKSDLKGRRASFEVFLNEKSIVKASCTATFLNPAIAIKHLDNTYILRSTDRIKFLIIKEKEEIGYIDVFEGLKGELQFTMDIEEDIFEDFMLFFVYMVYASFYYKK